jgi:hypothetical protein
MHPWTALPLLHPKREEAMKPVPVYPVLLAFALGPAACAPQLALAPPDLQARAVEFPSPSPGKARLYVFRQGGIGRELLPVVIDGVMLGSAMHNSFLVAELPPGSHVIASPTGENVSTVRLETSAGQIHFVKLSTRWGWKYTRSALVLVDETEGRDAIRHSRMVETISP